MPVRGGAVIKRRMRVIRRNVRAEIAVRLDQNADDLLRRANGLAPQLEGFLIGSGQILRRGNSRQLTRIIYYTSPYAVVRHEDFYNLGPISVLKRSPDGEIGRKFLSRPFDANFERYNRNVGEGVTLALRQSLR